MPIFSRIFIGWFVTCQGVTSRDARKSRVSLAITHVAWRRSRFQVFIGCFSPRLTSRSLSVRGSIPERPTGYIVIRRILHFGFNQWRTQKLFMGGFIQWHRVVICIWCALFVTSQNDVIVLFPNQRFGEVCWHNMHIFLYIHSSCFMCQCTEYKLLELQVRLSEENTYTQRYDTAVRNCKKYQASH